ncbi:MAG: ribonuclease D [Gammaproteobacteria bacterium]
MADPVRVVSTPAGLSALCNDLRGSRWLAVDTEFIRERTYYPQFCLLQIANGEHVACVDPLALDTLDPLLDMIYDASATKVFHAGRQDLEIFFNLRDDVPRPVFDTQIAASLLGYGEQVSYASLIKQALGIQLPKSLARTDWQQRPLHADQLSYAADDVRYLSDLYLKLSDELESRQRSEWLRGDFESLCDRSNFQSDPTTSWQRIRGVNKLRPQQLAVLRALAAWREQEAIRIDRPRKRVLSDASLLDLARLAPGDPEKLRQIRSLDRGKIKHHGEILLATIRSGLNEPQDKWPALPPRQGLSSDQQAVVDLLMAQLRERASHHGISPASIASRNMVERMAMGELDLPLLSGWRARLAGNAMLDLLAGKLKMSVKDGQLRVAQNQPETS